MINFHDIYDSIFNRHIGKDADAGEHIAKIMGFDQIQGHDKLKRIIKRAIAAPAPINLLFIGSPGSAKSMFLRVIMETAGKYAMFVDGTNTTNRILSEIAGRKPKVICIDELEKMPRNFQEDLLQFAETGIITVMQQNRMIRAELKNVKIFATANDVKRITAPMKSRFQRLYIPDYTLEDFVKIAKMSLPHLIGLGTAEFIARCAWEMRGDIRDVIRIGRLVGKTDGPEQVLELIEELDEYRDKSGDATTKPAAVAVEDDGKPFIANLEDIEESEPTAKFPAATQLVKELKTQKPAMIKLEPIASKKKKKKKKVLPPRDGKGRFIKSSSTSTTTTEEVETKQEESKSEPTAEGTVTAAIAVSKQELSKHTGGCDSCGKYARINQGTALRCSKYDRQNRNGQIDSMHQGILCRVCYSREHEEPDEPCRGHLLAAKNGSGNYALW